jgi:flagellar biosynthesis protein FlhG
MRRIWTLAGGKGGAGRSLVAANLGIALARAGRKVTLVDLDPHGAALHGCLGFGRPVKGLQSLEPDSALGLDATAVDTPVHHLRLVAGLQGPISPERFAALLGRVAQGLEGLEGDVLLLDCGSGRGPGTLDAFALGTLGILVATPEPPALEGACLFADAHLRACLERTLAGDVRRALNELLEADGVDPERLSFRTLMVRLGALDAAARDAVATTVRRVPLELVLTQVRDEADEEAGAALSSAFLKAFGATLPIAGLVAHDPSVLQAIQKHRPLAQQFPNTPATKGIVRAAERLLQAAAAEAAAPEWEDLAALSHYRVMEVVPKASSKEIQAAYQVLKRAYAAETTPLLPILHDEALQALSGRVEDAYRSLIFLESRVLYDKSLVDDGQLSPHDIRGLGDLPAAPTTPATTAPLVNDASSAPDGAAAAAARADVLAGDAATTPAETSPATLPPAPAAERSGPRAVPLTGEALRQERQRLNLTLEAIASRTKIRQTFLIAIEEEKWDRLPSPVFLRGFVREFALCLGLPAEQVTKALLSRRDQATAPPRIEDPERRTA